MIFFSTNRTVLWAVWQKLDGQSTYVLNSGKELCRFNTQYYHSTSIVCSCNRTASKLKTKKTKIFSFVTDPTYPSTKISSGKIYHSSIRRRCSAAFFIQSIHSFVSDLPVFLKWYTTLIACQVLKWYKRFP